MQTGQPILRSLLESTKQFFVPHFQRPYTWEAKQWKNLWNDLIELHESNEALNADEKKRLHFMGSIVSLLGSSVPEGIPKFVLIDGQQRLTTLMVLLAALRDWAKTAGAPRVSEEVQLKILINQFADGEDFYKLLPTEGSDSGLTDRYVFKAIVDSKELQSEHRLVKAYTFFLTRLKECKIQPEALKKTVLDRLILVSITLDDSNDNPHAIFESLNHKGAPLKQSDLVRNYFFMKAPSSAHGALYDARWMPIETTVGKENLEEFLRQYLMRDGGAVKLGEVYAGFKDRLEKKTLAQLQHFMDDMLSSARHFVWVTSGTTSLGFAAADEAMSRVRRLDLGVATAFMMAVVRDQQAGKIDWVGVCSILRSLENFAVRRFVCSVPTHGLNKSFATLYKTAVDSPESLVEGARIQLARRGYPSDSEVREHFPRMRLYRSGDGRDKAKFVLERIDRLMEPKEFVVYDNLTIEHVMPQTPSAAWKASLPPDWEEDYASLVDTPGNLTLTGYNSELGNLPFAQKREYYLSSPVRLNQYFAALTDWDFDSIRKRSDFLLEHVLEIWPTLDVEGLASKTSAPNPTGTKPKRVTILGETESVDTWKGVLRTTLQVLLQFDPELGSRLQGEIPRYFKTEEAGLRSPLRIQDEFFAESHFSAKDILHVCQQVLAIAGIDPKEFSVEY